MDLRRGGVGVEIKIRIKIRIWWLKLRQFFGGGEPELQGAIEQAVSEAEFVGLLLDGSFESVLVF